MGRKRSKLMVALSMATVITLTTISSYSKAEDTTVTNTSDTQTEAADIKSKSEVVYATLTSNGGVNAVYVVNHFELSKGGNIVDYGDYSSVMNLTESKPISLEGDTISLETDAENLYYQGNLANTELPWIFSITYDLDGAELLPQELAGKTGKLGIHINVSQNDTVDQTFYENYMLQISLTLNADLCTNIDAPDATIADAGNNKMLAFTVMPDKGADYQVSADVKDFTMSGIEISAMPFSMSVDLQDTDDMLKDFNQLTEAISDLNDGVGKLADGTTELSNGADELVSGSVKFKNGLAELKKNSTAITEGSSQINTALSQISSSLNGALSSGSETQAIDLTDFAKLPQGLTQLADGLEAISGGLTELQTGYTTAFTALDAAIQVIPEGTITKEMLDAQFTDASKEQQELLDQLYASYIAAQTVKATYSQVQQAFASVAPTMSTLSTNIDTISTSLDGISSQLEGSMSEMDIMEQLGQLSSGLSTLASNYATFDAGLNEYLNGVGSLADGYRQFDAGLSDYGDGVGKLSNGMEELSDGTTQLNDEVSKMPDLIQDEIDQLMSEYDGSDFTPVSFVSSKNENTDLVQFVLKCEGIELPEEDVIAEKAEDTGKDESIWDRLIALFQ